MEDQTPIKIIPLIVKDRIVLPVIGLVAAPIAFIFLIYHIIRKRKAANKQ